MIPGNVYITRIT